MGRNEVGREVLSCKNLKKSFFIRNKEFPVLRGINLRLNRGEVVLITGKSGAGKSTLISLLGGLEPASDGEIFWQGAHMQNAPEEEWAKVRKKKIGIVFQDYNLISSWSARENVESTLLFSGFAENKRRHIARDIMEDLGILQLEHNKPAELSEGQQQRVAVARTIVMSPLLILADEPTGGVDPETGDVVISALLSLVKNNNACMLVTTHGGSSLPQIADRIFRLDNGEAYPD